MSEGPNKGRSPDHMPPANSGSAPGGPRAQGALEAFATQVLSVVASNNQAGRRGPDNDLVEELIEAVQVFDDAPREEVMVKMEIAGITDAGFVDHYLPEAARRLGAAWCEDEMSFADVTIGSARLQAMLRDHRAPQTRDPSAPLVLVVVPEDAYHTLGAGVVADQLRRLGCAARMALGMPKPDLAELVESHDFNAVMISAASCERLETLRELVNCIRKASRNELPIMLGGSVTDTDTDIRTLTGADYVSNNPEEALKACGLTIPTHAVDSPERRG
ncbi:MAG: cobalamin B12-binding domain-containing protein [Pseudomonadota bacterium]